MFHMIKVLWKDPVWSKVIAAVIITIAAMLWGFFSHLKNQHALFKDISYELMVQVNAAIDSNLKIESNQNAGDKYVVAKPKDMPPTPIWTAISTKGQIDLLPEDSRLIVKKAYDDLDKYGKFRATLIWKANSTGIIKTIPDDDWEYANNLKEKTIAHSLWAIAALGKHYRGAVLKDAELRIESPKSKTLGSSPLIKREGAIFLLKHDDNDWISWISMTIKHPSTKLKIIGFWPGLCDDFIVGSILNDNTKIYVCNGQLNYTKNKNYVTF